MLSDSVDPNKIAVATNAVTDDTPGAQEGSVHSISIARSRAPNAKDVGSSICDGPKETSHSQRSPPSIFKRALAFVLQQWSVALASAVLTSYLILIHFAHVAHHH